MLSYHLIVYLRPLGPYQGNFDAQNLLVVASVDCGGTLRRYLGVSYHIAHVDCNKTEIVAMGTLTPPNGNGMIQSTTEPHPL